MAQISAAIRFARRWARVSGATCLSFRIQHELSERMRVTTSYSGNALKGSPKFLPTLVVDAGNSANIGWARSTYVGDCALGESGDASTLADAIDWLAAMLRTIGRATLGVEALLWTPRRNDVRKVTAVRVGEGDRPWTASAGACATTAGLGDMGFIFGMLAGVRATVRPETWTRDGGLLMWEAFISGGKGDGHAADALIALNAFERRLRSADGHALQSDLTPEPAVNLAVACALASGVLIDVAEIGEPTIVVKARKR